MEKKEYSLEIGGRTLKATFSDLAEQANGSVLVQYGETIVLATVVMGKHKREGVNFFPLTVDYEEKFYAAGAILGGQFVRREGRPSEEAILTSRFIDRTIRPLFNQKMRNDVHVVVTTLSLDEENEPGIIGIIATSLALATSDIPWNGPVSAVRVGHENAAFEINPSYKTKENLELDLMVSGQDGQVNMIEAEAKEVSEETVAAALERAVSEIEKLQAFQQKIVVEIGKAKTAVDIAEGPTEMRAFFDEKIRPKLEGVLFGAAGKSNNLHTLGEEWLDLFEERFPEENTGPAENLFEEAIDELLHREILGSERRPDGRKINQLRPLYAEAGGLSSVLHGAGLFYRGGTHVLSVLTLGGPKDSQLIDGMEVRTRKYFMHHYNFPPFSSGETGRMGGMNRRSIGHGALAEKALRGILPDHNIFPYTIRIVSETMASNGSTSMASVCASSLALMDGGVPIKRPAAGIAMGLIIENAKFKEQNAKDLKYKILTDIQGPEDHHGDMDFKVAGTRMGVCAIQMDVKIDGIPVSILTEVLNQAKEARLQILDVIEAAIPAPRPEPLPSAPKIIKMQIPVDKIGAVIGPGGKVINQITEKSGAEMEIEQDGTIFITGRNGAAQKAKAMVEEITREYQAGDRFPNGKVTRILDFGAFVQIGPTTEGLVHISEIAPFRVDKVTSILSPGDIVPVVIKEIDQKGRLNLSIKMADPNFAKNKANARNTP